MRFIVFSLPVLAAIMVACTSRSNVKFTPVTDDKPITAYRYARFSIEGLAVTPHFSFDRSTARQICARLNDSTIVMLPLDTGKHRIVLENENGRSLTEFTYRAQANGLDHSRFLHPDQDSILPLTKEEARLAHTIRKYRYLHQLLPPFALPQQNGHVFTNEHLKGKITLLNFWTYGCLPCRAEIPALNALAEQWQDHPDVQAISLYKDSITRRNDSLFFHSPGAWSSRHGGEPPAHYVDIRFNQIPNAGKIYPLLGIESYPINMVIGPEGQVLYLLGGARVDYDNMYMLPMFNGAIRYGLSLLNDNAPHPLSKH